MCLYNCWATVLFGSVLISMECVHLTDELNSFPGQLHYLNAVWSTVRFNCPSIFTCPTLLLKISRLWTLSQITNTIMTIAAFPPLNPIPRLPPTCHTPTLTAEMVWSVSCDRTAPSNTSSMPPHTSEKHQTGETCNNQWICDIEGPRLVASLLFLTVHIHYIQQVTTCNKLSLVLSWSSYILKCGDQTFFAQVSVKLWQDDTWYMSNGC